MTMHPGQLEVSVGTVRMLVDEQFPQWRSSLIEQVLVAGTVNILFRIGERLAARFPRELTDIDTTRRRLESEAEAAGVLLGRTRFDTPEPVAVGDPGPGYPLPWSTQTWVPGVTARHDDPGDSVAFAHDLAEFIGSVRSIDTNGRSFTGSGRGGDLQNHDEWIEHCFRNREHLLNVARLRRLWSAFRDLPRRPPSRS